MAQLCVNWVGQSVEVDSIVDAHMSHLAAGGDALTLFRGLYVAWSHEIATLEILLDEIVVFVFGYLARDVHDGIAYKESGGGGAVVVWTFTHQLGQQGPVRVTSQCRKPNFPQPRIKNGVEMKDKEYLSVLAQT